jgi:hypothetical protein
MQIDYSTLQDHLAGVAITAGLLQYSDLVVLPLDYLPPLAKGGAAVLSAALTLFFPLLGQPA